MKKWILMGALAPILFGCAAPVDPDYQAWCGGNWHTLRVGLPEEEIGCFLGHPISQTMRRHLIVLSQVTPQGEEHYYSFPGLISMESGTSVNYIITVNDLVASWGNDGTSSF